MLSDFCEMAGDARGKFVFVGSDCLTSNFLSDSLRRSHIGVAWSNEDVGGLLGVLVWISGLKTGSNTDIFQ